MDEVTREVLESEARQLARRSLERLVLPRVRPDLASGFAPDEPVPFEPGLVVQLLECRTPSGDGRSGGGFGSRVPASLPVLDMLALLDEQTSAWLASTGVSRAVDHNVVAMLKCLRNRLPLLELGTVVELGEWASAWVRHIEDFFNPPRRLPVGRRCPACELHTVVAPNVEGEYVRMHCLYAVLTGEGLERVECYNCSAVWPRSALWELLSEEEVAVIDCQGLGG